MTIRKARSIILMNININEIAETLLWDNVSAYVEKLDELKRMLEKISSVKEEVLQKINCCEVLDTEEFCILTVNRVDDSIQIEFEMPFILYCWKDKQHLLCVTAVAKGKCTIPDESKFDYKNVDFSGMNKKELLAYGKIVKIHDVAYQAVEVEEYIQ